MSQVTAIAWTDSTRNFWSGCTKVGPGCDGCYAEAASRRFNGVAATGQAVNWGAGATRLPHLEGAARELRRWNKAATGRRLVFLNSQSDFFDNEVPQAWRDFAWSVIRECSALTFQILTKRVGNIERMLPPDWGSGYPNVWLGITCVNQEEADRDVPKLLQVPATVRFLSLEPMLGPIDLARACSNLQWKDPDGVECCGLTRLLDWVIVGGESEQSGHRARPFDIRWARDIVRQCKAANVPVFVKQMGATVVVPREDAIEFAMRGSWQSDELAGPIGIAHPGDRSGADPDEWPADLRVREFPPLQPRGAR